MVILITEFDMAFSIDEGQLFTMTKVTICISDHAGRKHNRTIQTEFVTDAASIHSVSPKQHTNSNEKFCMSGRNDTTTILATITPTPSARKDILLRGNIKISNT